MKNLSHRMHKQPAEWVGLLERTHDVLAGEPNPGYGQLFRLLRVRSTCRVQL